MWVLPALAGFMAWAVFHDRVVIDAEGFQHHTAVPAPEVRAYRFRDYRKIRHVEVINFRGKVEPQFEFYTAQGRAETLKIGDRLRSATADILAKAQACGVRVVKLRKRYDDHIDLDP